VLENWRDPLYAETFLALDPRLLAHFRCPSTAPDGAIAPITRRA
jgi:hypothetical protein